MIIQTYYSYILLYILCSSIVLFLMNVLEIWFFTIINVLEESQKYYNLLLIGIFDLPELKIQKNYNICF